MKKFLIFLCLIFVVLSAEEDSLIVIKDFKAEKFENIEWLENGITISKNCKKAYMISVPLKAETYFNVCTVSWKASAKKNINLKVRASVQGNEWTKWQEIKLFSADINWKENFNFFQYFVSMEVKEFNNKKPILNVITIHHNKFSFNMIDEIENIEANRKEYRAVSKPSIVSRSTWGARAPKGTYSSHSPNKITIHHTWRPTAASFSGSSSVRGIQNYHMDNNGWMDIGYHFLIGTLLNNGQTSIYQGRPENKLGAHTGGNNTNNVGVCVIGDYTTESLHQNNYNKLVDLIAWLCYQYKINPDNIYGHRDFGSTSCPGNILYAKIPQIKQDVRKKLGQ